MKKVLTGELTFTSLKPCDLSNTNKREILKYFENSYSLNESVFTALADESAFYKCPDALRLPLIFYYGHTACVYVNKLILADLLKPEERINLEFETIFETGVDEMSWDDTENYRMGGKFQWPSLDEVTDYRRRVRRLVRQVIGRTPLELPVTMTSPWWAVFMGMEHERIHIETSSVLIRQLPIELVERPIDYVYGPIKATSPVTDNELLLVKASEVTLGKPDDFPSYGWDNEYGSVTCSVPKFEASKYLVTNREFGDFVKAGGYNRRSLWSEEGWRWKEYRKARHPCFWVCTRGCKSGCGAELSSYVHCHMCQPGRLAKINHLFNGNSERITNHPTHGQNCHCNGHSMADDNGHQSADEGGGHRYRFRCMFDVIAMPWDWPAEVNYHEAKAFCAWKGPRYRLPAEAEHHVMRGPMKSPSEGITCDIIYQDNIPANINMLYGSSTPVNLFPPSPLGFHDVFGNVWEWVEDHFNGLPGFRTSPLYEDFSCPCFDGRHNGILGGSWISTGDEASRFARYAFRRHFFQHCGFRVVRDVAVDKVPSPIRLITTKVYIQDGDVTENVVNLSDQLEYESCESTFGQYVQDTKEMLQDQLALEYGGHDTSQKAILDTVVKVLNTHDVDRSRALQVGCGAGWVTFHLANQFNYFLAQDTSGRCVDTCLALQKGKTVPFASGEHQGEAKRPHDAGDSDGLTFKQLSWLPNEIGNFNFVLSMKFDSFDNAEAWTVRLKEVVVQSGMLLVLSEGLWTEKTLQPLIGKYFQLIDKYAIPTQNSKGHDSLMTIWKRQ